MNANRPASLRPSVPVNAAAVPQERSPIEASLESLVASQERLHNRLGMLRDRLQPVLADVPPSSSEDIKRPRMTSELAETIMAASDATDSHTIEIELLLSRLAL